MFFRNVLLVLGVLCILGGLGLGYLWLVSQDAPVEAAPEPPAPAPISRASVLSATHDIASGSLLQQGDVAWKEIALPELRPGNLVRGQISEAEFMGALAKRDFANGEAFVAGDLVKASDRRFLASTLKPGTRAISISVDAAQSASGLIVPGNYVDVILTQSLTDQPGEAKRKIVAETILQNIRVVAVDQSFNQAKAAMGPQGTEARIPKTVTLELTKRQAEMVFVALQLGRLQLSVRPVDEASGAAGEATEEHPPTWAGDVSPALQMIAPPPAPSQPSASTLEGAVRRPPAS